MPQLIKKNYLAGTTWFYRFACAIVAQARISLMTRLRFDARIKETVNSLASKIEVSHEN